MFENLTKRVTGTLKRLSGFGKLTAKQITAALDDIEAALLDADVGYEVTQKIRARIQERAVGHEVLSSLNPADVVVKIVHDELVRLLKSDQLERELNLNVKPPAVYMLVGLQGAGKTTTVAKLARLLRRDKKKTVLVVSTDTVRPAAIEQLQTLAANPEVAVEFFPSTVEQNPKDIAKAAINHATKNLIDVVLIDTAGRREIDETMMSQLAQLHQQVKPVETLFVADGMLGQTATRTVKVFNEKLKLSGVILTKMDGDSRGGAALSLVDVTGVPIKFMGVGEKVDGIDYFDPERIAGQILGMGDIVALVRQVEDKVDREKAEKVAKNMSKGQLSFQDFFDQLQQMRNMGGIESLLKKLPGGISLPPEAAAAVDDKKIVRMMAMIQSMTQRERLNPDFLYDRDKQSGGRKKRIAAGAGVSIVELNRLLKQFKQMRSMTKKFSRAGDMKKMFDKLKGGGQF
ncbi:MAG: signal recognition particle protein [Pseudomonadota bacterium]|nr:signal recognition particle protein [Pseudomonadota bacterium]